MTQSIVDTSADLDSIIRAAARAVIEVLPLEQALEASAPERHAEVPGGRAVSVRFTGSLVGEIVVVVDRPVVDALAQSPLGALDLTQALKPALTAASHSLGRVVFGPLQELDGATALAAVSDKADGLIVALHAAGQIRAAVGIALTESSMADDSGAAAVVTRGSGASTPSSERAGMDLLRAVEMEVTAELGRTRMTLNELLSLSDGAIIELDRAAGAPADILVNGRLIARGEVVVIDENFGLRITEIVSTTVTR